MSERRIKPLRVTLAIAGGLLIGLGLIKLLTPATAAFGEDEAIAPSIAPRQLARASDAGRSAEEALISERVNPWIVTRSFPVYPRGGTWVRIGERLDTNRVPMSLVSFETADSDAKVLEFYARHFETAGLAWQGIKASMAATGVPAVSATDVEHDLQLSVVAFPHPGGTTVILAAADMKTFYERVNTDAHDDGDFPSYPGSAPAVMRALEGGRDSVMVSFATKDTLEQVESFYRSTLPTRGFREVAAPDEPKTAHMKQLTFVAEGTSWRLFLSQTRAGTAVTAQGAKEARP